MADDAERAERIEVERFQRATFDLRANIFGEHCGFAQSELRGWRDGLIGFGVEDGGAIAERPEPGVAGNGERRINGECAALIFGTVESFDDGARRDARGPDESFGSDFAVGKNDFAWLRIYEARLSGER